MALLDEEIELQQALAKLQTQIEQQKVLLKKLMESKQKRIQEETKKLNQIKCLIDHQSQIEKKELKLFTDSKINKPEHSQKNKGSVEIKNNQKYQSGFISTEVINKTPVNNSPVNAEPVKMTKFARKILANRKNFYYKNRKFFHGYKFVLTNDAKKLSIVSTAHEITGEPLENANMLPVSITLSDKTYIKSAQGNYYLEGLSKKAIKRLHYNNSKTKEKCVFFTRTGNCSNLTCNFKHNPEKIALCPMLQKSKTECSNKVCKYSHKPTQFNSPSCIYFQENKCTNKNCIFTHKKENESAPICREFSHLGYCEEGLKCIFNHNSRCPDLKEYGRCLLGTACHCFHNSDICRYLQKVDNKIQPNNIRNEDNDRVIQIVYDDDEKSFNNKKTSILGVKNNENKNNDIQSGSDSDDDNVEFIVGPVGHVFSENSDYIKL